MNYDLINKENINILVYKTINLDSNNVAELQEIATKTIEEHKSLILDFVNCETMNDDFIEFIFSLQKNIYTQNQSFALCNLTKICEANIKEKDLDQILNIAPKQIEAIDLVSMEALERELMSDFEEED